MRSQTINYTIATLAICLLILTFASAFAQGRDRTLWYRGYFDGKVTLKSGRNAGYYYEPSRPTKYPIHEADRFSDYLPCDECGYYHRPGAYVPELRRRCDGNGTHLDPDVVYRPAPHRLPGQYYYEKQNHFRFRVPITADWPFMKYENRRDSQDMLPYGRRKVLGRRLRDRH